MIHGQGKKLSWDELRTYDVVLTTYGTLGAEFKRLEVWLDQQKLAGHERDYDRAPMKKLFPLSLGREEYILPCYPRRSPMYQEQEHECGPGSKTPQSCDQILPYWNSDDE
jgi:hypothetical protein